MTAFSKHLSSKNNRLPNAMAVMIASGITTLGACALTQNSACGADLPFRDNSTWCGDPEAVQPADNPYVRLAENNVTRSMSHPDVFWSTRGYSAPESSRKGDAKLGEKASAEMDALAKRLAEKPSGYWEILTALECVRLFQKVPNFPADKIAKWKEDLKPSIQSNFETNNANTEWMSVAPNTLHQSAAILQLASILYGNPEWSAKAAELVRETGKYQEEDGAFRYIRGSGPSQIYFGFDSTFLGRYYQLSRDPVAKGYLIKMARFAKDILANGLMEGSTAPWWKHHWTTGGPIHGVEVAAGLSRDPLCRSVAQYRLKQGQPYYFSYVSMYFWDPTIPLVPIAPDLCRYNTNFAGPQLRRGAWQVVMPGKAYSDTGIGCSVVSGKPFAFDGYVETVAIPVLKKGEKNAHGSNSLLVVDMEESVKRGSLVGDGWIASGWTFQPRRPFYANPTPPPPEGWRVVQAWFADAEGMAGWIMAVREAASSTNDLPRGFVSVGHPMESDPAQPSLRTSGEISLKIWGDGAKWEAPEVQPEKKGMGPSQNCAWVSLPGITPAQGTASGYGLSAAQKGGNVMQVSLLGNKSVLDVLIKRPKGTDVRLLFNPTSENQKTDLVGSENGKIWVSGTEPGKGSVLENKKALVLAPCQLAVFLPALAGK
ncbi:MAG: hypothetical protein WC637_08035 [Victivallales bacterium]|jgi:hypothetical protein